MASPKGPAAGSRTTVHKLNKCAFCIAAVHQVAKAHGISFVAAGRAVKLVERKILTEPKRRRNRVFRAAEVLVRLERG